MISYYFDFIIKNDINQQNQHTKSMLSNVKQLKVKVFALKYLVKPSQKLDDIKEKT